MSLQKESEWEKTIKEIADELWELLPPDFFYKNVDRKTMYNWIKTRLENVLSNREKEIAEEVRNIKGYYKDETGTEIEETPEAIKDHVLSILKH